MLVVFDTNIVISGSLWSGAPNRALAVARSGQVMPLVSEAMLDEIRDIILRPKFAHRLLARNTTADEIVAAYVAIATIVSPADISPTVLQDLDDDTILACAIGGDAEWLITGDEHLLRIISYQRTKITNVHAFLIQFE